jgi:hypothetical protein
MVKKGANKKRKRQKFDPIVKILATKHGLTTRQIRNIRDGKRRNDIVLSDYTAMKEWFSMAENNIDQKLLKKIKELLLHKKK